MIKIDKDYNDIPASLNILSEGQTTKTHNVRIAMMRDKQYIKQADSQYKEADVKEKLEALYNHKCAYCEQYVEQYHVEHYRPKKGYHNHDGQAHNGYYWISLSWDNLMLSCPTCNICKGSLFDIQGKRKNLGKKQLDDDVNTWSLSYDQTEQPMLINPEREDPNGAFVYDEEGGISPQANNARAKYTVDTCKLNRRKLRDARRKILVDFRKDVIDELNYGHNESERKTAIDTLVRQYVRKSEDPRYEFLEFRKYSIKFLRTIFAEIREL